LRLKISAETFISVAIRGYWYPKAKASEDSKSHPVVGTLFGDEPIAG
jgi:hypothetical protein